jgi:O-antigen ligase
LAWAGLAALAVVVALAVFLEYGARERMSPAENAALAPNHSAALQLIKAEPRPRIWAYYLEKAQEHPWIGVGFGRTVPAIFYGTKNDPALAAIDTNAQIHAHNFLLDWLLQTGLFGLILLCTLLVAVGRHAWQLGQAGRQQRIIACAVLVSIIGMLLRNLTDDFMVYANATMFWATQGALLGLLAYAPMTRRPTGN